jgi:Flp pilus assembly protein protease CpaA
MDRRAVFFICAAIVALALAPATDIKNRWVPEWLALLYAALALLSLLDSWSQHRSPRGPEDRHRDRH